MLLTYSTDAYKCNISKHLKGQSVGQDFEFSDQIDHICDNYWIEV
jgi:hypothetical protein